MTPEKKLWQDLKKKTETKVHWTRIEAWVGAGIPDLNGACHSDSQIPGNAIEFWLELKVCKTKVYKPSNLWRPQQIAWQHRRSSICSNVFNLVSHPLSGYLYIYLGSQVRRLVDEGSGSVSPVWSSLKTDDWTESMIAFINDHVYSSIRNIAPKDETAHLERTI